MLSMKGREPYIKMQLWLEDPQGVDKLRLFENGASDLRKRRNSSNCPSPSESPPLEKKAKIEETKAALSQPFDLFRMWYQHQQAQQQLQQENEDSKSDSSGGEKTRRKSSTPQQYLGSQVDESND